MAFWQIVILFSSLALLFVVWPLLQVPFKPKTTARKAGPDATQLDLYREHLVDLESSFARGEIDAKQLGELKIELQKTLLAEGVEAAANNGRGGGKKMMLALAVLAPIVGLVLYSQWGSKKDWEIYQLLEEVPRAESQEDYDKKLRELVVMVQARLNQTPDNLQLTHLLAQSAMSLQDYDQAVDAYRKILIQFPDSPGIIANLAQAMFYRAGNTVTPEVREYTQKALQLAPMMPEMLGLAGIDAKNQGDYRSAIRYWKMAVQHMDPNSRAAQGYLNGIAKAEQALVAAGGKLDEDTAPEAKAAEPAKVAGTEGAAKAEGETAAEQDKAEEKSTPARIQLRISLADSVKVQGGETLFVYARAWQGPKMPLAIQKLSASQLPVEVSLDESMAMAPGMTLHSFPELELVARISKSGSAVPQSGDWQGTMGPIKLGTLDGTQNLVISQQVP